MAYSRARQQLVFFGDRWFLSRWRSRDQDEQNLFARIMPRAVMRDEVCWPKEMRQNRAVPGESLVWPA